VPEDLLYSQRLGLVSSRFTATLGSLVVFSGGGGFPSLIMVKFLEVSGEPNAYNLRVTQSFQVDAEEKRRIDMRRIYRMV